MMVGAIRELIELLLTEIAISGSDGTRLAEIWDLIETFYKGKLSNSHDDSSTSKFSLDRALQEDLWGWLTLNPEVSVGQNKEYNGFTLSQAEEVDSLRVFVSEDRTWKALTGHEKDESKVPATEFALLSIIASCRSQGILQTELVRRSGQDGRSVPKRTDALNAKGHIEKRHVQAKSAKTSLCIFSRFATVVDVDTEVREAKSAQQQDIIDMDAFCQSIFHVLKQYQIIARNDLKEELGFSDNWRRRILGRAIRKFETIGCIQRVKARSQFHETMKSLHPCVLLIREPTEADMKLFKSDYKTLFSALDQENEDVEEQAEMRSADHVLVKWTPDVNVPNLIASLIHESGTTGRTNADVIMEGFGKSFRRPSENTLNRMTEGWQLSQPSHLKHHAIVRDTALNGTVTHYVHYTYPHFKELVDTARADWEAVTFRPRDAKSSRLTVPPPDALSITDQDGLAPLKPPQKAITERDNYCVVLSKGIANYKVTNSDPVAILDQEGKVVSVFKRETDYLPEFETAVKVNENLTKPEPIRIENFSSTDPDQPKENVRSSQVSKAEKIEAELKKGKKSAKEVFADFGLDESWTHVAVRLMERETPGVYITEKGKARPAGKRQGRPRESQIAIFRSSTLVEYFKSLPQSPINLSSPLLSQTNLPPTDAEPSITTLEDNLTTEPTNPSTPVVVIPTVTKQQMYSKEVEPQQIISPSAAATVSTPILTTATSEENNETTVLSEVQTIESIKSGKPPTNITESRIDSNSEITKSNRDLSVEDPQVVPVLAKSQGVNDHSEPNAVTPSESESPVIFSKSRRLDKEGSVARLRRSIIMNVIEKAGGAFPAGSELWHAFSTVWMKHLNHPEKPDSRTVKTVVKHLVDAGKLRQMTFSGKGPKGIMVTRSIVMVPDISPSNPLVTNLKQALLKTNYYIPDNVEVDPNIAKIVRGNTGALSGVYAKPVPVESDMTVNLRNKPALVVALEKKKEQSIQRLLSKPIRLMGIKNKGRPRKSEGITSFSRPVPVRAAKSHPQSLEEISIDESTLMDIDAPKLKRRKRRSYQEVDRALSEIKRRKHQHTDSSYDQFLDNVENVSQWELTSLLLEGTTQYSPSFANYDQDHPGFIHHTVHEAFEHAPIAGSIRFATNSLPKQPQISTPNLRVRQDKPSATPKPRRELRALRIGPPEPSRKLPELQPMDTVPINEPFSVEPPTSLGSETVRRRSSDLKTRDSKVPTRRKRPAAWKKRRRGLKDLPISMVERLKYAIIAVRTIAGGSQGKNVDWNLVVKAFPDEDSETVVTNGKLLLNRDRRQLAQMQDEVRSKILAEYRKRDSAIPTINFNNMATYNWDEVVTWAAAQYYTPSGEDVPVLPAVRAHLKQSVEVRVDHSFDEFEMIYTANPQSSITRRTFLFASRPYLKIAQNEDNHDQDHQSDQKEVAKCWILSNIVAKDETYNSMDARRKLSVFTGTVIEDSTKELVRDRFLAQANRGRVMPGRNFTFTDQFNQTFGRRRAIDTEILKRASKFKKELDECFKRDGIAQVKYDALDGDVLAVMALAAEGRIHILPSDPPATPFGLTEGNYETRALDKAIFKFQIDLVPDRDRYEYGNPARDQISRIRSPIDGEEIKRFYNNQNGQVTLMRPPLWLDINGRVHKELWESIVSSIIGILAIRPKLDVVSVHEQFQKYIAVWDVERVLDWLEKIGLVEKEDRDGAKSAWVVKEYWWMVWD